LHAARTAGQRKKRIGEVILGDEGREDIAGEMQRSWDRCWENQEELVNRCAESGEETRSILVLHGGFPRAKKSPGLPCKVTGS